MGTQLILTVGTNPLPVWVAWHHLKDKLPEPVHVRLVHTAGTVAEKDRLQKYCQGASLLDPIQTSAGNPGTVRGDIRHILRDLSAETTDLHVHYTGGTKVMGVETVSAIEAQLRDSQNVRLQTSYLDPRGASGPTIVSRSGPLVKDTRWGIDPCLSRIAELDGFTIGPFEYRYWSKSIGGHRTEECPAPRAPSQEQCDEGMNAFRSVTIDPDLLEYGAYAAFEEALKKISERNSDRNNYEIFHSVYVRRAGTTDPNVKPFELDVVAVLGYQIVVVSCTVDSGHDRSKQKGMEAILRARQLGGDEARAIVLCSAHPNTAKLIEDELKDEMGSASEPLQIWGKNKWRRLPNEFYRYLCNDLHWI